MRSLPFRLALVATLAVVSGCGDQTTTAGPEGGEPAASSTPPPTQSPTADPAGDVVPADLDPALVRLGAAYLRFARGEPGARLPVDTPVTVLFGGAEATTIDAADADDPRTWHRLCNDEGGYAERSCPLSALRPFEQPVTFTADAVQEPCSRPHGLRPQDVGASMRVSLVASTAGSCLDFAAVELYADDGGQLVAVDLVLGSP